MLVQDETHGTYFGYALYDENPSEEHIDFGLHLIELRKVLRIISSPKVVRRHQNGIQNDNSCDESIKPLPFAKPDQGISDAVLVMENEQAALVVGHVVPAAMDQEEP